jgi:hypothetical protein
MQLFPVNAQTMGDGPFTIAIFIPDGESQAGKL